MGYRNPGTVILSAGHYDTSPNDSTNYYFGEMFGSVLSTSVLATKVPIGFRGRIIGAIFQTYIGTVGSNEAVTLNVRLNDTTNYAISATIDMSQATIQTSNYALSIPVVPGDFINMMFVTPAWATNPLAVRTVGSLIISVE